MYYELKPYGEYKEIDLYWLKKIPCHWEITRNKNVMKLKKDIVGDQHFKYTLLSLTLNGIIPRDMVNAKGKFPKDFATYQSVEKNDLVFCLFDIDETPRTVGLSPFDGMITGAYTVFKIKKNVNEKYLYYYYLSLDQNKLLRPFYSGLRKVISTDTFLRIKMPLPPREEQDQIVRFLDSQLAKINKFIKAKKKLIQVLKEQKQVVIDNAVTKGINPNTEMKASNITWIEEIPIHWELRALKRLTSEKMTDGPHETPVFVETGIPFVSAEAVYNGKININSKRGNISKEDHEKYCKKIKPQKYDIFIVKSGSTTGKSCIVDFEEEFSIWSPLALVRCNENNDPYFIFYSINSTYFQLQVQDKWSFGTQPNIGMGILQNLLIATPSLQEQKEIVEYIKIELGKIDKTIDVIEKEIDLITEYRTRLVSDVVTGKVDVRNIEIDDVVVPEDTDLLETDEVNMDNEEVAVLEEVEV